MVWQSFENVTKMKHWVLHYIFTCQRFCSTLPYNAAGSLTYQVWNLAASCVNTTNQQPLRRRGHWSCIRFNCDNAGSTTLLPNGTFEGKKISIVTFQPMAFPVFPFPYFLLYGLLPWQTHEIHPTEKPMKHSICRVRLLFVYSMTNHWWCFNIWGLLYKGSWALKDASRPSRDC